MPTIPAAQSPARTPAPAGSVDDPAGLRWRRAEVAEPADAAVLNTAGGDPVRVQIPTSAPGSRPLSDRPDRRPPRGSASTSEGAGRGQLPYPCHGIDASWPS